MSDSSDEENLDLLREAADNDFFKNSLYKNVAEESIGEEKTIEAIPSLRIKDEYDQFRLFNLTPQFQKYVGNALSDKLEKYLIENLSECCEKKRKKKKLRNSIKLLNSSKYPIEVEYSEDIVKPIKVEAKATVISKSDLKSIVITGEEILDKIGTKCWSNRSKAPLFRYTKDVKGSLRLIEPEFK